MYVNLFNTMYNTMVYYTIFNCPIPNRRAVLRLLHVEPSWQGIKPRAPRAPSEVWSLSGSKTEKGRIHQSWLQRSAFARIFNLTPHSPKNIVICHKRSTKNPWYSDEIVPVFWPDIVICRDRPRKPEVVDAPDLDLPDLDATATERTTCENPDKTRWGIL